MTHGQRDDRRSPGSFAPTSAGHALPSWFVRLLSASLAMRIAVSLLLLAFVGSVDIATGFQTSFSVFYLVPALFAGGFVSFGAGRAMAVASVATAESLHTLAGHAHSTVWIAMGHGIVRLAPFLLVNELVNMLRLAHAFETGLARTDSLTGIANARVFNEHAGRVIAQSRRDGRPFTITYIDLDRFKHVNDDFGHSEGNRLLQKVATIIEGRLRVTDVVARLGGDEFGILMPETGAEEARKSLERIAASLAYEIGDRWGVGATFGAVTFTEPPDDVDCAVRQADNLMYRGKEAGRGCVLQATWPESGVRFD